MARAWFDDLPTGGVSEMLRPEDDAQELWELSGKVEAFHNMIRWKRRNDCSSISLDEVETVMGWDEEACRRCGHPASEE